MILLSFDTEEFDVPREHGVDFKDGRIVADGKHTSIWSWEDEDLDSDYDEND